MSRTKPPALAYASYPLRLAPGRAATASSPPGVTERRYEALRTPSTREGLPLRRFDQCWVEPGLPPRPPPRHSSTTADNNHAVAGPARDVNR